MTTSIPALLDASERALAILVPLVREVPAARLGPDAPGHETPEVGA